MEDFLYILALLLWVVFSIYKKNQKKKQNTSGQPLPLDENQEAVPKKPRSILEQILLGEEAVPIPYEVEEEEPDLQFSNATDDDKFIKKEYNQQISAIDSANNYDFDPTKEGETEGVLLEDDDNLFKKEDPEIREEFDLRQAVIFSEILKRPYAN